MSRVEASHEIWHYKMEVRVYDSFSESKEGSSHGRPRSSAVEAKGGLSQLLSEAAHTLQGAALTAELALDLRRLTSAFAG